MPKKHITVVAAVILRDGKVFCAQRNSSGELGGKWEFPGGKIEDGELPAQALQREIREELNSEISVQEQIMVVDHEYTTFTLTMYAFWCTLIEGTLELSEHTDSKWLVKNDLFTLDWAAADVPIVHKIQNTFKQ